MKRIVLSLIALAALAACAAPAEARHGQQVQAIAFVAPVNHHAAPVQAFKIRNTPLRPFVGAVAVPVKAHAAPVAIVAPQAFYAAPQAIVAQPVVYQQQQFNAGCAQQVQAYSAPVVLQQNAGHSCAQFFRAGH